MVRVSRSVFACGINKELLHKLEYIEKVVKSKEGIEGDVSNSYIFGWLVRFVYNFIVSKPELFEAVYRDLKERGLI